MIILLKRLIPYTLIYTRPTLISISDFIEKEQEFDILGRKRRKNSNNSSFIPFKYQGQYEDIETGLYYNCFRYYDSCTGNYIGQD
ncbi:RHS repeat domain-containing protein [Prevotella jejuni]|uniref:RHS repeat domain-containing protein n=1 Tax=Prevotella jejuni TaxID=1177574 RepID=UPI0028DD3652|nr:RHS repeat-associated core domain-containing protein [Prevotella jejuni]